MASPRAMPHGEVHMKVTRVPLIVFSLFFVLGGLTSSAAESVIAAIPVSSPSQLAVNFDTHLVYVADTGGYPDGGRVRVIDELTNQVSGQLSPLAIHPA